MRHLKKGRKLNRTNTHRASMISNLASSLVFHKRIRTTLPKAKTLKPFIERLVTYSKYNDKVHGRRLIISRITGSNRKKVADLLIHDIAPQYNSRDGGYTRIIKLENRKNDNAEMCFIEFVKLTTVTNKTEDEKGKETKE